MSQQEALRQLLVETAQAGGPAQLTYQEVLESIGGDPDDPNDLHELQLMLELIDRHELTERRPMLSSLVVHESDNIPGDRFFQLARAVGRLSPDGHQLDFFIMERDRTIDYWQQMR